MNVLEYAALIAAPQSTHVISFIDKHSASFAKIADKVDDFVEIDTIHELVLQERPGR